MNTEILEANLLALHMRRRAIDADIRQMQEVLAHLRDAAQTSAFKRYVIGATS